ncbi:MAG: hypothetical protein U0Y10_18840 [Spirosomataceae bacterium]
MLKWLKIPYLRESIGLLVIVLGTPVIFFFRETVRLAPGKSWFTAVCLVAALVMMIPSTFLKVLYKPNFRLFNWASCFLGVSFFYLLFYNPFAKSEFYVPVREYSNFVFIFVYIFLLINVPNKVKDILVPLIALLTFAGSIALLISLVLNPNYILGQRAAIYFGDGEEGGNPHVFAKNGYAGVIASVLLLRYKSLLIKAFAYFSIFLSVVIIIMTQTRGVLLSLFIAIGIFLYFNLTKKQLKKAIQSTFTIRNLFFTALFLYGGYYYLLHYTPIFDLLGSYAGRFTETFASMLFTASGKANDAPAMIDPSSQQRVLSFHLFKNYVEGQPEKMLFGLGYRYAYLDVPVLEAFLDCGVVGGIGFLGFILLLAYESYRAMKTKPNDFVVFLAYFYVTYFVGVFSAGRPFDTSFWFIFALMIRFMGIKYLDAPPPDDDDVSPTTNLT